MESKVIRKCANDPGLTVELNKMGTTYWIEYKRDGKDTGNSVLIGNKRNLRILRDAINKELGVKHGPGCA